MTMIEQMPNSWRDITLSQFQELKALEQDESIIGDFEFIIEQLAVLLDTDSEDELFEDMDIDELLNIINNVKWLRSSPSNSVTQQINDMYCIDLKNIKFGEFLDLEHYFKDNYFENLHYIAAIMYRRKKQDEWGNDIIEPYIYNLEKRALIYLDMSIVNIFGLIKYYIEWKENIMQVYKNLFENPNFDKIENEDELDAKELAELKKEIEEDKRKAEWGWESILWELSGNDLTKYDELFDTNFILVMNTLSLKKAFKV